LENTKTVVDHYYRGIELVKSEKQSNNEVYEELKPDP
jgi:hypothetical protein